MTGRAPAAHTEANDLLARRRIRVAYLAAMEPTRVDAGPPAARSRARELGVRIGSLPPGPTDSLVDVPDVAVGHRTVWRDEPPPPAGRGVARTGVTAIVPFGGHSLFHDRVPAATAVLNGAGAAVGQTAIDEWGVLETPILLASSMAIGRVYDAVVAILTRSGAIATAGDAVMPVVAECDDGFLNTGVPVQVEADDVEAAVLAARGPEAGAVSTGVVGAGTGMRAFGLKGGIGSASRRVTPVHRWSTNPPPDARTYTLGVLLLANYGALADLTVDGVRVGEALRAEGWPGAGIPGDEPDAVTARAGTAERTARGADGSCIVVVATDAPLVAGQLRRIAVRAGLGLARTGSVAQHGSGEIFLAFSTGLRMPRGSPTALRTVTHLDDEYLDPFFAATVEATEAAAIDALFSAATVRGRDGHVVPGLPVERTLELLAAAGRLRAGA